MHIRTTKRSKKSGTYEYQQLVRAYRSPKGPRQEVLLHLGKLPIPKEQFPALANRIEELLTGQKTLPMDFPVDERVEKLAQHFAHLLIQRKLAEEGQRVRPGEALTRGPVRDFSNRAQRSIGREAVVHWAWKRLRMDDILKQVGLKGRQREVAALLVMGRAVGRTSERKLLEWARQKSALEELLGTSFQRLSHNTLYRVLDALLEVKEEIEKRLYRRERDLFGLSDTVILYDLTNTFLEGSGKRNGKARRGYSKDGRHDAPLLTLGLALDAEGFIRKSRVFSGNTAEVHTLLEMVEALRASEGSGADPSQLTVVVDRGLVSEANLEALRQRGYHYLVMARGRKPPEEREETGEPIRVVERQGEEVVVRRVDGDGEVLLVCHSERREAKEQAMRQRWEERFEEALRKIDEATRRPGGIKRRAKVLERLGRLRALYPSIAPYYEVHLHTDERDRVYRVSWERVRQEDAEWRFGGFYLLRTSHTDWSEEQIWKTYVLLTEVEDTFRVLKSELHLRPIFHQKEDRTEAHIFVTVLAYHLVQVVRTTLRRQGVHYRWSTLLELLEEHSRLTTTLVDHDGSLVHVRNTAEPSLLQRAIYEALGISPTILPKRRLSLRRGEL